MARKPLGPDAPLTLRVIADTAAWDAIRTDWEQLHAASPVASTTLDFIWLRTWWQVYGPIYGAGGLRIVTLWRGPQLVGALPMYIELRRSGPFVIRCLRLVSTGEAEYEETCPDYLNLLHLPGDAQACASAAWQAIAAMHWHTLELLDLPDDSPLRHGQGALRVKVTPRDACPVAFIGHGFEAYLAALSANKRAHARQDLRKVESAGAVFGIADAATADEYLEDLIRVHQQRWTSEGKPGCFAAARFTEFHRLLVRDWIGSGQAILARLSHRGEPWVVLYGFVTAGKFDLYQAGMTSMDGTGVRSPGTVANMLLMDRLAMRGVARYDFLRGTSSYKKSLTSEQRDLIRIGSARPGMVVWFDQGLQLALRIIRKIRRKVFRGSPRRRQS